MLYLKYQLINFKYHINIDSYFFIVYCSPLTVVRIDSIQNWHQNTLLVFGSHMINFSTYSCILRSHHYLNVIKYSGQHCVSLKMTKYNGFLTSLATESYRMWDCCPGFGGGTLITLFPSVYSPVRTLQRYILLCFWLSGLE